jgi:hypothetical protein
MDKKKAHTKEGSKHAFNFNDTSAANQRNIILDALKDNPKTTIELRRDYGVMQPAPRILELRAQGYRIDTVRTSGFTDDGIKHNGVAQYVLVQSKPFNALN